MSALPTWAEKMTPVDMSGAAALLGVSRRYLVNVLRAHPHYESRGVKKVFYPEHIARLREAIGEQSPEKANSSTSSPTPTLASGKSAALLPETAFDRALALASRKTRSNLPHASKRGSAKVLPMAKRP